MEEFNVELFQRDNVQVVKVIGTLDAHTTADLEKIFDKLIEEKQYKIVVDFSSLSYISSAGLGVFMAYIETMRENNGDIKFSELQTKVFHVFDLLGFPVLYQFFDKTEQAIAKFNEVK